MTLAHDFPVAPATPAPRRPRVRDGSWSRAVRVAAPVLRHRLVQFALVGGLLFAVAPRARSPRDIAIRGDRLAALHAAEAARAGSKTLPEAQAREVDQRALEDEILYREGVRLGLDANDGIVRQRIVQKVLFLAEEMGGASRPASEAEIQAFFDENQDRWATGRRTRFAQIYQHRPEALAAWATSQSDQAQDPPVGEPSPVGAEIDGDDGRIDAALGAGFAAALAAAPEGRWSGPVRSAFGWHLVRVLERRPARPARLDEVRSAVASAYGVARRKEATARFLAAAFARYHVEIDGKPLAGFTPSGRLALRAVSSGED